MREDCECRLSVSKNCPGVIPLLQWIESPTNRWIGIKNIQIDPKLLLRILIGVGGVYVRVLNEQVRVDACGDDGESFWYKNWIFWGTDIYITEKKKYIMIDHVNWTLVIWRKLEAVVSVCARTTRRSLRDQNLVTQVLFLLFGKCEIKISQSWYPESIGWHRIEIERRGPWYEVVLTRWSGTGDQRYWAKWQ